MRKLVEIKIGDKNYKLFFSMRCIAAAERELISNNILTVIEQAKIKKVPPSLSDMFVLFKYALAGGNPEIKENEAEELYVAAVNEYSIPEVLGTVILALKESGVLGMRSTSDKTETLNDNEKSAAEVKE